MNIKVTSFEGGYWFSVKVRNLNERSLITTLNSSRRRKKHPDLINLRGPLIELHTSFGGFAYMPRKIHSVRFPSGREWDVVNGIRWGGKPYKRTLKDQLIIK